MSAAADGVRVRLVCLAFAGLNGTSQVGGGGLSYSTVTFAAINQCFAGAQARLKIYIQGKGATVGILIVQLDRPA